MNVVSRQSVAKRNWLEACAMLVARNRQVTIGSDRQNSNAKEKRDE
jgi:hypothetical protein